MSNYTKVRILIGVGDIAQQEMTTPVRIHYKVEGVPSLQGEIGRHSTKTFRVWLTLVGVASVSNTL